MSIAFVVPKGGSFVIDAKTVIELHYSAFRLEDGAVLELQVRSVTFDAGECTIGNDVTIKGAGISGRPGIDGKSDKPQAGYGHSGWRGDNGSPGTAGGPGCDITITAGVLHSIGSNFLVNLSGGTGGKGGKGGDGGIGGNAVCPPIVQRAGNGGGGGNGGNGGMAVLADCSR